MTHYFQNDSNLISEEKMTISKINGQEFKFITDNGVFSKKGLDFGTRTLLESLNLENIFGNVLDFGCGYGPIGIYVSKNTKAIVHMVDINRRSLELARKNVSINCVSAKIYESNIYSNIDEKFDYIITNPPIRVGKDILYQILFGAKEYLNPKGHLILVVNKDQGAKSLMKDLEKEYKVNLLNKNKGFFVIDCEI